MKIFLAIGMFLGGIMGGLLLHRVVFPAKEPVAALEMIDAQGARVVQQVRLGEIFQALLEMDRIQKQQGEEIKASVKTSEEILRAAVQAAAPQ